MDQTISSSDPLMPIDPGLPSAASDAPESPGGKLHGMDAMAIGRSILGPGQGAQAPVVPGYEILGFAGSGGTGVVWQARRLPDGLAVALKLSQSKDPEMIERLSLEADSLRALDHPHIVKLLDFTATDTGDPVLVMEWIDGPVLAAILPDGGFAFEHALQLYLPILEAVNYAHSHGIIHRDLKPSNVLLTADNVPKVSDFGLARSLNHRLVAFSLTRSGAVAGTVEYLAPECYRPDYQPSAAADIYALGVLLYELLAGTPPRGAWLPLSQKGRVDVRVDELIGQIISPDPARRPASAALIRQRLEEIRSSRPRLAGTPLVTPAVRIMDRLWTVLGFYLCGASFCATLSQTRTPVPALFDLTFASDGLLLRGFLAVWVLSLGIGLLSLWQIIRLWRFRQVPLRESLPQPFGARLGHTRLAAWLVGGTQALSLVLPVFFTLTVVAGAFHWWTPETPSWQNSLVVTPWMTDEPTSVWQWNPRGFVDGGTYWLKEAVADFEPGQLRVIDKTSFFVCVQPGLMVLAAGLTGGCALFTLVMAWRQWWPHRKGALAALICLSGGSVAAVVPQWQFDAGRSRRERLRPDADWLGNVESVQRLARPFAEPLFRQLICHEEPRPTEAVLARAFQKPTDWMKAGHCTPEQILTWSTADAATALQEQRTLEFFSVRPGASDARGIWPKLFTVSFRYLEYRQESPGTLNARLHKARWSGPFRLPASLTISDVEDVIVPFYEAEILPLSQPGASRWLEDFLAALATPGGIGLESHFHESLYFMPGPGLHPSSFPINTLREERSQWHSLRFTLAAPLPEPTALPGARWQVNPQILQSGIRLNGTLVQNGIPFTPEIHLACINKFWRIVYFSF